MLLGRAPTELQAKQVSVSEASPSGSPRPRRVPRRAAMTPMREAPGMPLRVVSGLSQSLLSVSFKDVGGQPRRSVAGEVSLWRWVLRALCRTSSAPGRPAESEPSSTPDAAGASDDVCGLELGGQSGELRDAVRRWCLPLLLLLLRPVILGRVLDASALACLAQVGVALFHFLALWDCLRRR